MERIHDTLRQLMDSETFQQRYDMMKQRIYEDERVKQFIAEHQDEVTDKMVERSLTKLYEFIGQGKCHDCPSLGECRNLLGGHEPELFIRQNSIDVRYNRCERKIYDDQQRKHEALIRSIHIPKELLSASLDVGALYVNDANRVRVITELAQFANTYEKGTKMKGLYLHGTFGVGKTYLLAALANRLADKGVCSYIVYVPEFFREMKSALQDQTLNEKIDAVKKADVLMLDDIGAETVTSWVRDELLGPILQYRMQENAPTFFTSNFNLAELEVHLAHTSRGDEEVVKAKRIVERVRALAVPFEMKGKNYRHEK